MMSSLRARRTVQKVHRYEPSLIPEDRRHRGVKRSARLTPIVEERVKRSRRSYGYEDVPKVISEENDVVNQLIAGIKESVKQKEVSRFNKVLKDQNQKTSSEEKLMSLEKENQQKIMTFETPKRVKCEEEKPREQVRRLKSPKPKQTTPPPATINISRTPKITPTPFEPSFIDLDRTIHPNLTLFAPQLRATPNGEVFATVLNERLDDLLKKENIIDLLTNPKQHRRLNESGLLLTVSPQAPPLIPNKAAFVFFVDGTTDPNTRLLSRDGMSPWHTNGMRPKSRKMPLDCVNGFLKVTPIGGGSPDDSEYHLMEYSARLPRERRLRKKVYYVLRNNKLYGDALVLYNYEFPGQVPVLCTEPQVQIRPILPSPPPQWTPEFEEEEPERILEKTPEKTLVPFEPDLHYEQADSDEEIHPLVKAFEPRGHSEYYEIANYPEYEDHIGLHKRDQYPFWYQIPGNPIPCYFY